MDMGVKSMTKEPVKLAVLGILCVAMLFTVGRTVMTVTGGGTAPAAPAPPPSPAAGATPAATGAPPAATGAAPSSTEPAGVAGAAIAAAHGAVNSAATTATATTGAATTGAAPAGAAAPGSAADQKPAPGQAAAANPAVAVYFPLPPDQLRNPFAPTREIQALIQPPAPPKATPPPPPANPVIRPPAPVFQPAQSGPSAGRSPFAAPPLPDVNMARLPPASVSAVSSVAAPGTAVQSAPRPSRYKMAIDAASGAAASIKGQVTLKGILVGQPSTAFATVGGAEQLLHPGDEVPGGSPGGIRFKIASINNDTMFLRIDERSIEALSGNNSKLAAELASVRVEIRQ